MGQEMDVLNNGGMTVLRQWPVQNLAAVDGRQDNPQESIVNTEGYVLYSMELGFSLGEIRNFVRQSVFTTHPTYIFPLS